MKKITTLSKMSVTVLSGILLGASGHAQTYVPAPYYTGFESGSLGTEWTATSSQSGTNIEVIQSGTLIWNSESADAYAGNYFLGMDYGTGGAYNLNQADLHLDLNGNSNLRFEFQWAEWNDETEPEDGIYISDDAGASFVKVLDLNGASYTDLTYTHFNMSLDSINSVHGLAFTSQYVIRLQQYDNYYLAGGNDGFLFDEINIYNPCNTSSALTVFDCLSYTVPSGDETYTNSGVYYDTIPNAALCDSIITINLTIGNTSNTITPTACNSYTAPDGATYTSSGTYQAVIPNSTGCDSTITINLTVNQSTSNTITPVACNAYFSPEGNTYTTSGIYTETLQTTTGCDSVLTIDLTVNASTSATITESVLDTYTVPSGDETYTSSGVYMDTLINAAGCDSVLTINLTVAYTGVDELHQELIRGYPNPASQTLHLKGLEQLEGVHSMTIVNALGQCVQVLEPTAAIDVVSLRPGMYYLVLEHARGTSRLNFIKK